MESKTDKLLSDLEENLKFFVQLGIESLSVESPTSSIEDRICQCRKCPLSESRTKAVPGEGKYDAELMFVGEYTENDTIHIKITSLNNGKFTNSLVFFNDPYDYRIHKMQSDNENIPLDGNWGKAVLVTACTNTTGSESFSYQLETEIISLEGLFMMVRSISTEFSKTSLSG